MNASILTKRIAVYLLLLLCISVGVWIVATTDSDNTQNTVVVLNEQDERPVELPLITRTPHTISFTDGTEATLQVADGFGIAVAAEGLGKTRFMTMSPDGRLFVPDMVDYNLSHEGALYILDDFNEETKRFETRHAYLSELRGPNNVAFYTDENGQTWLYLTLTEHLVRYPYESGDTQPSGDPEVIYTFPNEQHSEAEGVVWHITRTILFDDDTIYVAIGSGCNSCEESYATDGRPVILTMTPDGGDVAVYAEGIKNAVGLELVDGALYATENGVDHLGNDAPNDVLYQVEQGAHYGWPYCYELDGMKYDDTAVTWQNQRVLCDNTSLSFTAFDPHAAPLGVTYFENAHPALREAFLVAMQGSWEVEVGTGYQVLRVSRDGEKEIFIDGFLNEVGERVGRPVHVLQRDANSFFVSDDWNGRIYYVYAQ